MCLTLLIKKTASGRVVMFTITKRLLYFLSAGEHPLNADTLFGNSQLYGGTVETKKNRKIHAIIHVAALTAGGIGSGFAQIPGADLPILTALQTAMIIAIATEHDYTITKAHAKSILLTLPAGYGGRALSQFLIGWIPIYGNAINGSTAMALTETIGWAANAYFANSDNKNQPALIS